MLEHCDWFLEREAHCLTALDGRMEADQLIASVSGVYVSTQ